TGVQTCALPIFFQMHMFDPVCILFHHFQRVCTAVRKVAGIIEKAYILRICAFHKPFYLIWILDNCAHMMMESKGDAIFFFSDFSQSVQTVTEGFPLLIIHNIFLSENRRVLLALDAVALLRGTDNLGAHSSQKFQLCTKFFLYFFKGFCKEKAGKPLVTDFQVP